MVQSGNATSYLALDQINQAFVDTEGATDRVIQILDVLHPSIWRAKIGRSTFVLGEGTEKRQFRYMPPKSQRRGLQWWSAIQLSKKPTGADAGVDSTVREPYVLKGGWEEVRYGGFGFQARTEALNIRDLRFIHMLSEQLQVIQMALAGYTNDMWENFMREFMLFLCNDVQRIFVMGPGGPEAHVAIYNPFSVDEDGDNILTITDGRNFEVSALAWRYLQHHTRYLQLRAPTATSSNANGRPVLPIEMDLEDFERMVDVDPFLAENYRYNNSSVLIDGYGSVQEYRGYAMMHSIHSPRFKFKKLNGQDAVYKRIEPDQVEDAGLVGVKTTTNPEYLTAEFALAPYVIDNAYTVEIPPTGPQSPGGGTQFGAPVGYNGQWEWVNNKDMEHNPKGEKGYWGMEAEAYPKRGINDQFVTAVFYRRDVNVKPVDYPQGDVEVASSRGVKTDAVAADLDPTNLTIVLELDGFLDAQTGARITATDDAATPHAGVIMDGSAAPTYTLALDIAPSAAANWTTAGSSNVAVV